MPVFAKLPLTALRAFESAARLGAFKAAADELAVTPAAVSHQIKSLEESLGTLLFTRTAQGVSLSGEGHALFAEVHAAFAGMAAGLSRWQPAGDSQSLTLTTTPAFASHWLIARLGDFHRRYPHIHVRIETTNEVVDLARDSRVDIALRVHVQPQPGLYCLALLDEHFAVYAPPGWQPPAAPHNLELIQVPWYSATSAPIDWPLWCARAGHEDWLARAHFREYSDEDYALQAAIAGHGLVLASDVLVAGSVQRGLLQPYRSEIRLPAGQYSALCVPGRERQAPLREFLAWLGEQVQPAR